MSVSDIAFFFLENEIVYFLTRQYQKYIIDQPLDKISNRLIPEDFFRATRQFIVSRETVKSAANYFNRKIKLELHPKPTINVIVAKPVLESLRSG